MSARQFFLAASTLAFLLAATHVRAQKQVEVYLTAKDTADRIHKISTATLQAPLEMNEKDQQVLVDPSKSFQSIIGIGGALTDAAAETYAKLPEAKRRELIQAYYDADKGIGYSLARTSIHSCDFSSESYTYVDEGDVSLKSFSIAHDQTYRIPMIKEAIATTKGALTFFASPWSPPGWMKDNHDMLHGGKLKPEMRQAWSNYFVAFIKAYEKAGIPIWGLTVQNEPMAVQRWESCVFTADEEKDFVRDYLGPTLAKNGLSQKKVIIWDHNRTRMYERAEAALDDSRAAKFIWGVGFHWYVNDAFENVSLVKQAYPTTHLLLTEACNYPYSLEKLGDWHWGENYGVSMINDFNHGAEGWTDWNILLDEKGGPNHVDNFCYAPVHADTKTGNLMYMNSYYYIGHFSKFIRPGAKRVVSTSSTDSLLTTAFVNPDGSVAVIVMNKSDDAQPFNLAIRRLVTAQNSPAHSIMTLVVR